MCAFTYQVILFERNSDPFRPPFESKSKALLHCMATSGAMMQKIIRQICPEKASGIVYLKINRYENDYSLW